MADQQVVQHNNSSVINHNINNKENTDILYDQQSNDSIDNNNIPTISINGQLIQYNENFKQLSLLDSKSLSELCVYVALILKNDSYQFIDKIKIVALRYNIKTHRIDDKTGLKGLDWKDMYGYDFVIILYEGFNRYSFAVLHILSNRFYYHLGEPKNPINIHIADYRARELQSFLNNQCIIEFTGFIIYELLWFDFERLYIPNNCGYVIAITSSACIRDLSYHLLQRNSIQSDVLYKLLQKSINDQREKFQSITFMQNHYETLIFNKYKFNDDNTSKQDFLYSLLIDLYNNLNISNISSVLQNIIRCMKNNSNTIKDCDIIRKIIEFLNNTALKFPQKEQENIKYINYLLTRSQSPSEVLSRKTSISIENWNDSFDILNMDLCITPTFNNYNDHLSNTTGESYIYVYI